ncbi:hypothetical protein [Thalassospira lucentensis]|uniref:hypothetical protein n=1 Tax=Thalassospira lucentensis TaxID=168935 RepID=UPI003AA915B3|tara:strand:+ start:1149 stop:1376 length:228 start_codon:yes stop_codon:yes gene_type:complete
MAHQISGNAPFNAANDPFTKRMPFGALMNRIEKYFENKRKRKNHSDLMSNLSHADLADLGLQRKFNGTTWYLDRM